MRYELTNQRLEWRGRTLRRIRALTDIHTSALSVVRAGDAGGWIEGHHNLTQDPSTAAWVYDDAKVFNDAVVGDRCSVRDVAEVHGAARVSGRVTVRGGANVFGVARLDGTFSVGGEAVVGADTTREPLFIGPLDGAEFTIMDDAMQVNCQLHPLGRWAWFGQRHFIEMEGRAGLRRALKYLPTVLDIARKDGRDFHRGSASPCPDLTRPTVRGYAKASAGDLVKDLAIAMEG